MSWKKGVPDWKRDVEYMRKHHPKGWRVVTLEIEGETYKFRVDRNDVILFVIQPKGIPTVYSFVGMTINQFKQVAESPLLITDPIVPPNTYTLETTLGQLLSPQFKNISPAGYSYLEKMGKRIADYLTALYDDYNMLDAKERLSAEPFQKFAVGLMEFDAASPVLPFVLAQQFILTAPETLGGRMHNIDKFFKEVTRTTYQRKIQTSYEKLYATFHDAQQLTDERMRGTLRQAEIREMHETQASKVIVGHKELEQKRQESTADLLDMMTNQLSEAIRDAWASDRQEAARRMNRSLAQIELWMDGDTSMLSLNKLLSKEPAFDTEVRMKAAQISETQRAIGDVSGKNSELGGGQVAIHWKEIKAIEEAKRMSDAAKEKFDTKTGAIVRQLESEGISMDSAIARGFPHLRRGFFESARNTQFGNPIFGIGDADTQARNRMHGVRKPVAPVPRGLKVSGEMFDKTGMLIKGLRPASKKFKIKRPDRDWRRKLFAGVLDIKLTIKDFREKESGAVHIAVLEHLLNRFGGGDAQAFNKLKKAIESGVDVANDYAWKTMLPTFVEMVHQQTGHFQGMDKLMAGKRGVFFEFVPPTVSDITINSRRPYNAHINLRWARINTSRSLAFYRDKEGQPAGERRRRVEQTQSYINAHKAKPSAERKRKAIGVGVGMLKEQRGQQFIIQKYLDRRKRSFLEKMDKQQLASSGRREISALFGDEAGAVVRKAVRSGESVTLALAQHLRAKPGDRINVFMNDGGQMGVTVSKHVSEYTPGTAPKPTAQKFTAVPTKYKRITTLEVPVYKQTEPMEPVSDSFRGAMRAIKSGGYSGNIFQRLANILWNIDVPLPDWNLEQTSLSQSQIATTTAWLRDYSQQVDTKLNQGIAEERVTKNLDDRVIGAAIEKIIRDPKIMDSTSKILMAMLERFAPGCIDEKYVIGMTI